MTLSYLSVITMSIISGALAAERTANQRAITVGTEPHACNGIRKRHNSFFVVNMARGMDRRHVQPMTTTLRNMAASLRSTPTFNTKSSSLVLRRTSLILDILVMVICTCQTRNPLIVSRDHIAS